MKKLALAAAVISALASATSPAWAQFGGLKVPKMPGFASGGGSGGDIDGFLTTTERAESLTRVSAIAVLEAVSSHESVVQLRETLKVAEAKSDPKEREAALRQVTSDIAAQLAAVDFAARSKSLESSLSDAQRKQLAVGIYNLALAIMMDKQAVEQGRSLTEAASANPMAMAKQGPKLLKVKDAAGSIGGQMGNLSKVGMGLPKLMSAAHLTTLPSSSTDLPQTAMD
jgi:hypothetical protein